MIIRPLRLNASHRNRRRTRFQWQARRSEMQFRRRLAIAYSNWRWSNSHIDSRSFRWRLFVANTSPAYLRQAIVMNRKPHLGANNWT